MLKKHFLKIVTLIILVLLGGSFYYSNQVAKKANEGIEVKTHIKGNSEASVKLVEYSDFQCPACRQFSPVIDELMEKYGEEISFEYRHFPLKNIHPYATMAAVSAEAASQQGKFWEMHDILFREQTTWSNASSPNRYFIEYAEEIGLNVDLFKKHLNSSLLSKAVDAGFDDARSRGFTGTPTFLLNGEQMQFLTFEEFYSQIESALEIEQNTEVSGENSINIE